MRIQSSVWDSADSMWTCILEPLCPLFWHYPGKNVIRICSPFHAAGIEGLIRLRVLWYCSIIWVLAPALIASVTLQAISVQVGEVILWAFYLCFLDAFKLVCNSTDIFLTLPEKVGFNPVTEASGHIWYIRCWCIWLWCNLWNCVGWGKNAASIPATRIRVFSNDSSIWFLTPASWAFTSVHAIIRHICKIVTWALN